MRDTIIVAGAEIAVVPIEDEESYRGLLCTEDEAYINTLGSARRRAESAAWRAAVRERLGNTVSITYNETGAPVITGSGRTTATCGTEHHIGVTHTDKLAVVIFSGRRCAIDMESTGRNFDRAASRFISPTESALSESGHPLFKCAVWCAKEALYKYSDRRELDLLRDIRITSTDIDGGKITGAILSRRGTWQEYSLSLLPYGGKYLIVYTVGP